MVNDALKDLIKKMSFDEFKDFIKNTMNVSKENPHITKIIIELLEYYDKLKE